MPGPDFVCFLPAAEGFTARLAGVNVAGEFTFDRELFPRLDVNRPVGGNGVPDLVILVAARAGDPHTARRADAFLCSYQFLREGEG